MSVSWRRPALALVASAALLGSLVVQADAASAAPVPSVVINEVESSGGTPVDWIELKNTGATDVDLSGYILKDSDDTHSFAIPASTTITAGGYATFDVDVTGGFGLGAADSARLFEPDGVTIVDSYSWTTHASTTYGRCPDGTGAFATTVASTKNAANSCAPTQTVANSVKINEVESSGGTPVDWIELKNNATIPLDISGYILKDSDDTHSFAIPASTTIAAGGYSTFDVDVTGGFGLGAADSARLFAPDGTTVIDSYSWTAHASTTYGRCPDGTGAFATTAASTKNAANSCLPSVASSVKINEVESSGGTPVDWIELKNNSAFALDISGYVLKDSDDTHVFTIPASTTIAAGGYATFDVDVTGGFGLGAADSARFFAPDGTTVIDSYSWTAHAAVTYGRCPDGTGAFVNTLTSTKNAANDCPAASVPNVKINEIESNGDATDWVELYNAGSTTVDLTGWKFLDNDPTHTAQVLPTASITAGGYYSFDSTDFGLGAPDSATVYLPDGTTVVDSYSWQTHAAVTYGRCPSGTGDFANTHSSTRNAANDCAAPQSAGVVINEVDSNADWVELMNPTSSAIDVSGDILKDNDDTHSQAIPAGTSIAAGGFLAVDVTAFGLGSADSARLFGTDGTTPIDSYTWTTASATSYGRDPDGTGAFTTTYKTSKGAANVFGDIWPGGASVSEVDETGLVTSNLSGLDYEGTSANGPLWAVDNGPSKLFRLVKNDAGTWVSDTSNGWSTGKSLTYTDSTGDPDTEGVTLTDAGASGGVYVSTERNNSNNAVSRPAVLRYDVSGSGATLTATNDWNLTADLPGLGANLGLEAITWIPDDVLVAQGFVDTNTGAVYDPASYPGHGTGLFFVGVEQNGNVYAYALKSDNTYTRIASFSSGFPAVMDLQYDPETGHLWADCDDTCNGHVNILDIAQSGANDGKFGLTATYLRPAGMGNFNNEGFALAPQELCDNGVKPVFWSDDTDDNGHSLRQGTVDCTSLLTATPTPTISGSGTVDDELTAVSGDWSPSPVALSYQWLRDGVAIDGATAATYTPRGADLGTSITVTVTGAKAGYSTVSKTSSGKVVTIASLTAAPTPAISGSAVFGGTLTGVAGTWTPEPVVLSVQWLRNGVAVPGATSSTYTPAATDVGASFIFSVTGTRVGYSSITTASAPVTITAAGFTATPVPTVSGTALIGEKLIATAGAWGPGTVALTYQWLRNGQPIAGATSAVYTLVTADAGARVSVTVTGTQIGYASVSQTSAASAVVKGEFTKVGTVKITGTVKVGKTVKVSSSTWSPKPSFSFRWYANGKAIAKATHSTYKIAKSVKGKKLTVKVTATKSNYVTVVKTSKATAKVK